MSNSNSVNVGGGGIGLLGAVFLVFLILKLTGHIAWSWWWVLAPLWMPFGIIVAVIGVILLFMGLIVLLKSVVK